MKLLEEKILSEGKALNKDILKVDSFINHQVDPVLMAQIGEAFAAHFKGRGITKVVTIESSGIAPALMTASALGVPMVILKKQPSQILNDNLYQTVITSFTKETNYELTLSKKYISEEDHVLIIDDFLANGEAATGAIRLLRLAHATIAGLGVLVEKSFQPGRKKLIDQGTEVYALARVGEWIQTTSNFYRRTTSDLLPQRKGSGAISISCFALISNTIIRNTLGDFMWKCGWTFGSKMWHF